MKDISILATGSSSFELANKINEPLTGRKWEYMLFPLSTQELSLHFSNVEEKRKLNHRLIFGYYPEIINNPGNEEEILLQIADSYLYKDILTWEDIKKPQALEKLLQAIAFQVGNLVSLNELSQLSGLSFHTVERYINILEKVFIIYSLSSFSRNLRNEIKKSRKIYFFDNGIRNAVIRQFAPIELRGDSGALWENYIMTERRKFILNNGMYCNQYFWRTSNRQEIDYIEERNGIINAYEFKWNHKKKVKFSKSFTESYRPEKTEVIHPENYLDFIQNIEVV